MIPKPKKQPDFKFNESISLVISCENQNEVDYFWEKLTENGEEGQCGWLKDKYGVSWQVVPETLGEIMGSGEEEKMHRAMEALLKMKKIEIEGLERA